MEKIEFEKGCWYQSTELFEKNKFYCFTGNPNIFLYLNVHTRDSYLTTKSFMEEKLLKKVNVTTNQLKGLIAYKQRRLVVATIEKLNESLKRIHDVV